MSYGYRCVDHNRTYSDCCPECRAEDQAEIDQLRKQVSDLQAKEADDDALVQSIQLLEQQVEALQEENRKYRHTLGYYADSRNYFPRSIIRELGTRVRLASIYSEFGERARITLGIKDDDDG